MTDIAIENGHRKFVSISIQNGGSFHSYETNYQMVNPMKSHTNTIFLGFSCGFPPFSTIFHPSWGPHLVPGIHHHRPYRVAMVAMSRSNRPSPLKTAMEPLTSTTKDRSLGMDWRTPGATS